MRQNLTARRAELKAAIQRARELGERYKAKPSATLEAEFVEAFNEVRHLAYEIARQEIEELDEECSRPRTQPARAAPQ